MTIILGDKNTASRKPTKIFKNQELSFVFAQMNAARCIGGQNKWLEAGRRRSSYSLRSRNLNKSYYSSTLIFIATSS